MNINLKRDVLRLLGRHYMLVVDKYCDMLKNRELDDPIEDIMEDFKSELMYVEDTAKEVQKVEETAK
nr:MAG TPA: hypothetical protein [Caudoviricetes sp.]